jgi:hypothetical protein
VAAIELISSNHVLPGLWTCECVNLHPLYQLIRNIRLVVVTLLAIAHLNVLDGAGFIIILIYYSVSMFMFTVFGSDLLDRHIQVA